MQVQKPDITKDFLTKTTCLIFSALFYLCPICCLQFGKMTRSAHFSKNKLPFFFTLIVGQNHPLAFIRKCCQAVTVSQNYLMLRLPYFCILVEVPLRLEFYLEINYGKCDEY
jgi:hypothetical protein